MHEIDLRTPAESATGQSPRIDVNEIFLAPHIADLPAIDIFLILGFAR